MEERSEPANSLYSLLCIAGFIVALLAGIADILAGFGTQWGLWHFRRGFVILRWAAYIGGAAGVVLLINFFVSVKVKKRRNLILSIVGLLMSAMAIGVPWMYWQQGRGVPAIHDITTDMEKPPLFAAIVPLRKAGGFEVDYSGPEIAAKQRAAYPDIIPLTLALPPEQAFKLALEAARQMGWQIVDENGKEGRIEAMDKTFWFGFIDDVVIRVSAAAQGSRIDVRSVSRVGRSDLGTNAKRIRGYLKKLREKG